MSQLYKSPVNSGSGLSKGSSGAPRNQNFGAFEPKNQGEIGYKEKGFSKDNPFSNMAHGRSGSGFKKPAGNTKGYSTSGHNPLAPTHTGFVQKKLSKGGYKESGSYKEHNDFSFNKPHTGTGFSKKTLGSTSGYNKVGKYPRGANMNKKLHA